MATTVAYHTTSQTAFSQWQQQPDFAEPPLRINGDAAHWDFRNDDNDYFSQPRALFNLMNPEQKQALFNNTAAVDGLMHLNSSNTVISVTVTGVIQHMVKVLQKHWA